MIEVKFYETYYFCNIVNNIIKDQFSYLRKLDDFYGNGNIFYFINSFKKYSIFHHFIAFVIDEIYNETISEKELEKRKRIYISFKEIPTALEDIAPTKLPIEEAYEFYRIGYFPFMEFLQNINKSFLDCDINDISEYMSQMLMTDEYDNLIEQTTKEVFHVLFQNRGLMLNFNEMMANTLELEKDEIAPDEKKYLLKDKNKLKRQSIPKWVERAVFFRDRGKCVLCDKDLSGILNLENKVNYDHIVPLDKYGFNDVSNIQLLCFKCNQEKKANPALTSNFYQSWYSYDK